MQRAGAGAGERQRSFARGCLLACFSILLPLFVFALHKLHLQAGPGEEESPTQVDERNNSSETAASASQQPTMSCSLQVEWWLVAAGRPSGQAWDAGSQWCLRCAPSPPPRSPRCRQLRCPGPQALLKDRSRAVCKQARRWPANSTVPVLAPPLSSAPASPRPAAAHTRSRARPRT